LASEVSEPSDADIEAAIVRAMLDGCGQTAELLTDKLRRRREERSNVTSIAVARARAAHKST
jgi:hypothetical protein